jgi:hypothetical protein
VARVRLVSGMREKPDAWEEARRAGFDLDLLESNLALPVQERWRQHDAALNFILKLQEAKAAHDAGLQQTHRDAH